jgi:predicted MFS family arabinose efflux permease
VPVGLALIGDLFAYSERGRAVGWLFGGMAGGMAVGSTAGALAEPSVGWRGLFAIVAVGGLLLLAAAAITMPDLPGAARSTSPRAVLHAYVSLLRVRRARRTYGYVGFNAVLHSGVYTWLGLYLHQRFALGPVGVGLGLLGYGIPGFALGPLIGRLADRHGRARLVPAGVAIGALAVLGLAAPVPLVAAALLVTLLSLGYDLTQPLLAGIVTDLPGHRGQAVAFMAVTLFVGFGVGSLVFQAALTFGFTIALTLFGVVAALAAVLALPTFADERAHRPVPA